MNRVFYTYVWGTHGPKGSPLTFTNKQARTSAIRSMKEGDLVFGVISRNPLDPLVEIPDKLKGRVVNVWQISHAQADTAEYEFETQGSWDFLDDGSYRWPFALQPIRTWIICDAPEFREVVGYTPQTHTQRAITTVQEIGDELKTNLVALLHAQGEELEVMTPRFLTIKARIEKLRQRHPFALNSYTVTPDQGAVNRVYIATLGQNGRTLKIGHAQDSEARVKGFNKFRLSTEPQWMLHTDQEIGSVQEAIEVEKHLGHLFDNYRTEPNNNEVYVNLDPMDVLIKLSTVSTRKI